jgi:hypothetical protein
MYFDAQNKLIGQLTRRGMSRSDAKEIAGKLAPIMETVFNKYLERDQIMETNVELMGSVSAQAVMKRVLAVSPAAPGAGALSIATRVIAANPSWTEDQVYAEVLKKYPPEIFSQALIEQVTEERAGYPKTRQMIAIGAVALLALLLVVSGSKRG